MPDAMPPEEEGPDEAGPGYGSDGEDPYTKGARLMRHAFADGDDEAAGKALKAAIKACLADEDEQGEPEGEGGSKKPNLAMILLKKKKG